MASNIEDRLLSITKAFRNAQIPHAFGGAIALAYYSEPRATADLDINIFLHPGQKEAVLNVLSSIIGLADRDAVADSIDETTQVRIRWEDTLIDLFFSNTPFHDSCAGRIQWVDFQTEKIPILSPEDLIIYKVAYDRPQDWLDIGKMLTVCGERLDKDYIRKWIYDLFDPGDRRLTRLEALLARETGSS
ncbi:MAG: hypothetical protein HY675_26460 [Chloroflexi bacterium]|nr:hypothetical protein [Chloroflexota bacterium]